MKMKRIMVWFLILLLMVSVLAGCSSKSSSTAYDMATTSKSEGSAAPAYGRNESAEVDRPAEEPRDGFATANTAGALEQEAFGGEMGVKIIKSGYVGIETLEFEETTNAIIRRVQAQGGFIASSNIQGVSRQEKANAPMRRASFKVRIPSRIFEQFLTDIGDLGNVTRRENYGEDISARYYDTEARVKTLTVQEDRLVTILGQAEKLQDILELERELSRVRYEIENLTGTLKKWDNLVEYSTLDIDVYEVQEIKIIEPEPVTIWDKITSGFRTSLRSVAKILEFMVIFFISAVPFLILFGIIGMVVYAFVKIILKKKG